MMSDTIFECILEMKKYKKEMPEHYDDKEFTKKYRATIKIMYALMFELDKTGEWEKRTKNFVLPVSDKKGGD